MRSDYGDSGPGWTKPQGGSGYGGPPHRGTTNTFDDGADKQEPPKKPSGSRRGILSPTFTSLATATISGLVAAFSAAAQNLDSTDQFLLGVTVGAGTYVAAKIGKAVLSGLGWWGGLGLGGTAGAAAGGALGGFAADKGEKTESTVIGAILGGGVTGLGAGVILSVTGALVGFWGGAYFGHHFSKDAALKYLFSDTAITEPAAPAHSQLLTSENDILVYQPAPFAAGPQ